ncbi:MAG TPA: tryptophan-rich sensory protein, partial [Pyrinomonadaceae bacterium]|nr:tryptophan-rich sensory protein [Pyrinomonadaceae bacterium]
MNDRVLSILVLVSTVATIAFNAFAAVGNINGVSPATVSDKYPTVVTPAGYTFSIWSLIYVGMIAFSIYQTLPSKLEMLRSVRLPFILSCVLNCAWILLWHHWFIGTCVIVIAALWASLLVANVKLGEASTAFEALMTKAPLGLYFGWVTAATLVNFAVYLSSVDVQLTSVQWNILGIAMLAIEHLQQRSQFLMLFQRQLARVARDSRRLLVVEEIAHRR